MSISNNEIKRVKSLQQKKFRDETGLFIVEGEKMVEEAFAGQIPKEMVGVMTLLVTKGHASQMLSVFEYFVDLVKEEKKIGKAHVTTAVALDEMQKAKVEQRLLDTTKYESFEMEYFVDESLIGGMVIRVGDRVVDSSLKTKLYDMTRELRNVQI